MRSFILLFLSLFIAFFTIFAFASRVEAATGSPFTVSTFNSLSIYWNPPSASASRTASVAFREAGTSNWITGYPLWYSSADNQYRGSLVHLKSGTNYEISLSLLGTSEEAIFSAQTWNETFPIGSTVYLPETSSATLTITQSGTPNGYVLYTPAPGKTATIDVNNAERNNIIVNASYVIIRGLTLKGAQRDAIHIYNTNGHDIVIENNDISGWGNIKYVDTGFGENSEAAIRANTSPNVERVIIQRNVIHEPRPDTNSWGEARPDITQTSSGYHPSGPQAVYLYQSGGNHVIRYNTIYSTDQHRFNDCIGGGRNDSSVGFPYRDSDIYGNYISHCWDNGIEAEGANRNVRIWGNYIDETYRALANRETRIGPLYVWRNVVNKSRKYPEELYTWAQEPHGSLGKTGGEEVTEKAVFYFHNTSLQPAVPGESITGGISIGLDGPMQLTTTRNNTLQTYCTSSSCNVINLTGSAQTNDFDYDMFNKAVSIVGAEKNGILGVPVYTSGTIDTLTYTGDFSLTSTSPGFDKGVEIPNFNSHLMRGLGPDIGAHEAGMPVMEFGSSAYLNGEPYTVFALPPPLPPSKDSSSGYDSSCTAAKPGSVPDLFQINRFEKSAVLFFTPASDPVDTYVVEYGLGRNTDQFGAIFTSGSVGGAINYTIYNLSPAAQYSFRVRAGNGCAAGDWSNTLTINTARISYFKYIQVPPSLAKKKTVQPTIVPSPNVTPTPVSTPLPSNKPSPYKPEVSVKPQPTSVKTPSLLKKLLQIFGFK